MAKKKIDTLLNDYNNISDKFKGIDDEHIRNQQIVAEKQKIINELLSRSTELTADNVKELNKLLIEQEKENNNQKLINEKLEKEKKLRTELVGLGKSLGNAIKESWKYLQESDKVIRQTILHLGMSGTKAEGVRKSFEGSARAIARMGGSLGDIQTIMSGYADETGRARVLSAQMVTDIASIGKGTALGIEQATKLGAQFEMIGFDAKKSVDYVQGIVDTSERMGVNTTKVLKNVSDNFKKLNTYTFQQGSKGFAQMAMYAEKMKIDMSDALNAASIAKGLEGAIDLAAQLQVMGGEFAKTDPFEMLFLSRNDPAKFTEKISDMTKGIVSFRKMADGTFESFISPADRDRLAAVGKSLGISAEAITEIAQRRAVMDKMSRNLAGSGLTGREKELIEGAAIFNAKSGKFEVQLAGRMRDITTLTAEQAKSFASEQVLLQERAKQALTFEETFKATLEIIKASLLPLLRSINAVANVTIKPLADMASKGFGGALAAGGILLTAAGIWKFISFQLNRAADKFITNSTGAGGLRGTLFGGKSPETTSSTLSTKGGSGLAQKRIMEGQGAKMKGIGQMGAGVGAGIGAAALGAGAGVGAAAAGISLLANAMNKLDSKKVEALQGIVRSISIVATIGVVAAAAVMGIGIAMGAAAAPLGAFSLAVLGIGAGIGIAAAGIGVMGLGLSKLAKEAKGAGGDLLQMGAGITAMAAGMALFTVGGLGLITFSATLNRIAKNSEAISKVGEAFKQINTVMSGTKEDFIAVERAVNAISGMNSKGGSVFADLVNLMKQPLKVEFADKDVQIRNNITLDIDGQKFMNKIFNIQTNIQNSVAANAGQQGLPSIK